VDSQGNLVSKAREVYLVHKVELEHQEQRASKDREEKWDEQARLENPEGWVNQGGREHRAQMDYLDQPGLQVSVAQMENVDCQDKQAELAKGVREAHLEVQENKVLLVHRVKQVPQAAMASVAIEVNLALLVGQGHLAEMESKVKLAIKAHWELLVGMDNQDRLVSVVNRVKRALLVKLAFLDHQGNKVKLVPWDPKENRAKEAFLEKRVHKDQVADPGSKVKEEPSVHQVRLERQAKWVLLVRKVH